MIENYDEKRLYHCISETMPEIGSKGYFFDTKQELIEMEEKHIIKSIKDICTETSFLFEEDDGGAYRFFYLLEPPAYRKFETVEEVKAVFGKAIELRNDDGELVESYLITGVYQKFITYSYVRSDLTKKVIQIKAGDVCFHADELLDTGWTIDGHPAGVKL